MSVDYITNDQVVGPYSPAVRTVNLIYTSGQIGINSDKELVSADVREQTKQALSNLAAVIKQAGGSKNKIIKTCIFLTDINDYAVVNEIYADFFDDHYPARSTVAVKQLPLNAKVEIEAIVSLN